MACKHCTSIPVYDNNYKHGKSQHMCFIIKNKTVIAYGHNTHSMKINNMLPFTTHAEMDAIRRMQMTFKNNFDKVRNLTLVVVRYNSKGQLLDSKPCIDCINLIRIMPIKKIIYSTTNNMVEEKISSIDILQFKPSSGQKNRLSWTF